MSASTSTNTVSLCMIARDNEGIIRNALESAKPWVDEIIVVDTGSTDSTPEIAKECGAIVKTFPWIDDFAAARNESLKIATSDWIFWMDTDDILPHQCGKDLQEKLATEEISPEVGGLIMQVHCPDKTERSTNENTEHAHTLNCATVVDHVKVVRNHPDIRFEGRIHEQILPSIRAIGKTVAWTDLYVVHSGSDQSERGMQRKLERDMRLLRMDVEERPNHPFVLFNLGMTLFHAGEHVEAIESLTRCIQLSNTNESHLRKAYALLADTLERVGQINEAIRTCWEGLGRYPNDPEIAFKLGRLNALTKNWDDAIDAFTRVPKGGDEKYFASVDPNIKNHKLWANLAVCYRETGELDREFQAWSNCLVAYPTFPDAWEGLTIVARTSGRLNELLEYCKRFEAVEQTLPFRTVCEAVAHSSSDFPRALLLFEKAIEGEDPFFALNEFARFLIQNNQWERAVPVLKKLRQINARDPAPHFNLGYCLYQLGKVKDARRALQASLQIRKQHPATIELIEKCKSFPTDAPAEPQTAPLSAKQTESFQPNPAQVIITTCLLAKPDPQRKFTWKDSQELELVTEYWAAGIINNQLKGIVLYDELSEQFIAEYSNLNIQFIRASEEFDLDSALLSRYAIIRNFLKKHKEIKEVFCTDLFDVSVCQNPFDYLATADQLCISAESTTIGENQWMLEKWLKVFAHDPSPELLNNLVLNPGVLGGSRQQIIDLCDRILKVIQNKNPNTLDDDVSDMPIFNSVLYNDIGEENFDIGDGKLTSVFFEYEYERDDVVFVHK